MNAIASLSASLRGHPELIQAVIRVVITLFTAAYIQVAMRLGYYPTTPLQFWSFLGAFLGAALLIALSVPLRPQLRWRPYASLLVDIGAVTAAMLVTDAGPFSPFFLFYLWIYVGYGSRYGRPALLAATALSLVSYVTVLQLHSGWQAHAPDLPVYLAVLLVLPLYLSLLTRALQRARSESERASLAKNDFLATMSHEIRTPMSGIIGMANLLSRSGLSRDQSEYLDNLRNSANALHELIDDVLDLTKIEAGKYRLEEREINPAAIAQGIALMFTPTANSKGLELISFADPLLPRKVMADGNRLRQVLLNLMSNAVKFTERGEVLLEITARPASGEQVALRVDVRDTGIGIPAHALPHIFDPFYQSDRTDTRRHGGTGLGTTISRELVELMGGRMGVESQAGAGAHFWFELPVRCTEKAVAPEPEFAGSVYVAEPNAGTRRVLLHYLAALGVRTAELGSEAELGRDTVLVILGDQGPGHAQVERARAIRSRHPHLPICRLTYLEHLEADGASGVFDSHLVKPVTFEGLQATLREAVHGAREEPARVPEAAPQGDAPVPPLRVLVAEDSDINARILTAFLGRDGHSVDRVTNGAEAVASLGEREYDLVFMDVRMPGMSGLEATRRWRAQEASGRRLPIVALTANASVDNRSSCLTAGMDEFLTKPVSPQDLARIVRRAAANKNNKSMGDDGELQRE